jgi:hypothetical protein
MVSQNDVVGGEVLFCQVFGLADFIGEARKRKPLFLFGGELALNSRLSKTEPVPLATKSAVTPCIIGWDKCLDRTLESLFDESNTKVLAQFALAVHSPIW